jgi:CheY-like chemotaxis protein
VTNARTALVVVPDEAARARVGGALEREGFEVRALADSGRLLEHVHAQEPDLVVLDEAPAGTGRSAALALARDPAGLPTPVVGLSTSPSVPGLLAWLRAGATDAWPHDAVGSFGAWASHLVTEALHTRVQLGGLLARLLACAERRRLTGTAVVFPGTPFEGRATFVEGRLAQASFGDARGSEALEQFLSFDDAPMEFLRAAEAVEPTAPKPASKYRPRVLVVEDVDSIRHLTARQLEARGYQVETAGDGLEGLKRAQKEPFDLVLADLEMPVLDGWGLLRRLATATMTREMPVLVLSAQDVLRDTLKAARAGARGYLKKTGHARYLLDAVSLLVAPRQRAWDALSARQEARVELRNVGARWLLYTMAELDVPGRLELADELGEYDLEVSAGQLVSATAQLGSVRLEGPAALEALLGSRATGVVRPEAGDAPDDAPWVFEAVDEACHALDERAHAALTRALAHADVFRVNRELADLYARGAGPRHLEVLKVMRRQPQSLPELTVTTGQPPDEVESTLTELWRRGVLELPGEGTPDEFAADEPGDGGESER